MRGIRNIANNCLINSLVQILGQLDQFVLELKMGSKDHEHIPQLQAASMYRSRKGGYAVNHQKPAKL